MKKIFNLIVLVLILVCSVSLNLFPKISWEKNLDSAIEKAKSKDMLIMIDIYSPSCHWCGELEKTTFKNKKVLSSIDKSFIALKLSPETMEEGKMIARRYSAEGYPTILFINRDGILIAMHNGYINSDEFIKYLDYALEEHKKVKKILNTENATLEKLSLYMRSSKEKEAKDIYNELVENNEISESEIPSYMQGFALLKAQNKNFKEATLDFNRIIEEYPDSEESYIAHYYVAIIMVFTDDRDGAVMYLEDILSGEYSIPEKFRMEYQNLLENIKLSVN